VSSGEWELVIGCACLVGVLGIRLGFCGNLHNKELGCGAKAQHIAWIDPGGWIRLLFLVVVARLDNGNAFVDT